MVAETLPLDVHPHAPLGHHLDAWRAVRLTTVTLVPYRVVTRVGPRTRTRAFGRGLMTRNRGKLNREAAGAATLVVRLSGATRTEPRVTE